MVIESVLLNVIVWGGWMAWYTLRERDRTIQRLTRELDVVKQALDRFELSSYDTPSAARRAQDR